MKNLLQNIASLQKLGGGIKRPPQSWCYVEAMKDE